MAPMIYRSRMWGIEFYRSKIARLIRLDRGGPNALPFDMSGSRAEALLLALKASPSTDESDKIIAKHVREYEAVQATMKVFNGSGTESSPS